MFKEKNKLQEIEAKLKLKLRQQWLHMTGCRQNTIHLPIHQSWWGHRSRSWHRSRPPPQPSPQTSPQALPDTAPPPPIISQPKLIPPPPNLPPLERDCKDTYDNVSTILTGTGDGDWQVGPEEEDDDSASESSESEQGDTMDHSAIIHGASARAESIPAPHHHPTCPLLPHPPPYLTIQELPQPTPYLSLQELSDGDNAYGVGDDDQICDVEDDYTNVENDYTKDYENYSCMKEDNSMADQNEQQNYNQEFSAFYADPANMYEMVPVEPDDSTNGYDDVYSDVGDDDEDAEGT